MYPAGDPRGKLAASGTPTVDLKEFAPAEYVRFHDMEPQESNAGGKTWYGRGQNFIIALTEAEPGAVFERKDQIDEYMVLLEGKDTAVEITWNGEATEVPGYSVAMVPPGDSAITVPGGGRIVRLFSTQSADLAAKCANASSYAEAKPHIPPFEPWPEPKGGWKVRSYSLDVPAEEGRLGRIFRCTTFMVNFFEPFEGPRDSTKLSPHHHDDFEQCSLALDGNFMHHIRWPWTRDMSAWRPDDHEECASPSICVIPPPAIHTSRWIGDGRHQLVDVFAPPRMDFSKQDGWVLNAGDYPTPDGD